MTLETKSKINNATTHEKALREFGRLIEIVQKLRGPDGCPWDKEQTQKTLTTYAIEEAYELAEAIESGGAQDIREELGDFLFQVILQAQVAEDEKTFNLADVIERLNEKMLHRHPHVFGDAGPRSIDQVWLHWDKLKAKEHEKPKPVFNYPRNMPALQASHKIGIKTEGYKFDWTTPEQVFEKVNEEVEELRVALLAKDPAELEHEIGDVLFSVAQLARHLGLEAEQCLRAGNRRFENRFNQVLKISKLSKDEFRNLAPTEMEALWQQAKNETAKEEK
jgi:tetrapyrrole methylase family protein/MazG family protein